MNLLYKFRDIEINRYSAFDDEGNFIEKRLYEDYRIDALFEIERLNPRYENLSYVHSGTGMVVKNNGIVVGWIHEV